MATRLNIKIIIFSLLPSILLVFLVALSAEIYLRLKHRTIESITGVTNWETGPSGRLTYHWDTYHPYYGWTNLPGYKSDDLASEKVTINSQGLRAERDYSASSGADTKRIAILGDSFTFGEEVDDDQSFPHYLEKFISNCEVLNFGVRGYGLGEMVLRLENEVFQYHPEHVILVIGLPHDLSRIMYTNYVHPKPAFAIESEKLAIKNYPVPTFMEQPYLMKHSYAVAWLFGRTLLPSTGLTDAQVLDVTLMLLSRAKDACSAKGIPMTVEFVTGPAFANEMMVSEVARDMVYTPIEMIQRQGITISDQTKYLQKILSEAPHLEDLIATRAGVHWAGLGNCLLAKNMAEGLVKMNSGWSLSPTPQACVSVKVTGYDRK